MAESTKNPQAESQQELDAATETPEDDNLPKNTIDVEDAGTLKKKVTVTVPQARIDAKRDEMFGELAGSAQVPGFRIGRAPRRLIEKRFGKEVGQDVRNALIGESIGSAIEESGLKTLGEPDLKLDEIELPDTGDMTFGFEVEIEPEFTLPETEGIEVKQEPFEVDDTRVDEYIENLRSGRARYEKTDQPSREGDGVLAGAKITGEGVRFENPRVQLRVAPGVVEGLPLVDLGERLAGKKPGDVVTIKTKAAETHPTEDWRGKDLTVELTVHEVSRRILPEIDDQYAQSAGFDGLAEFRKFIGNRLEAQVKSETQRSLRNQICEYLLDKTEFELPEGVVARHTYRALQRQYVNLLQRGVPRETIDENLAQLQASAEQQAKTDLKLSFILSKIAEAQGVDVSDDEINSRVAMMAQQYGRRPERMRQELASDGALEQLGVSLREEKALDKLLEEARIIDVKPEPKKPEAPAEKKAAPKAPKKTPGKAPKKAAAKDDKNKPPAKKTPAKKTAKKTAKKAAKKSSKK